MYGRVTPAITKFKVHGMAMRVRLVNEPGLEQEKLL